MSDEEGRERLVEQITRDVTQSLVDDNWVDLQDADEVAQTLRETAHDILINIESYYGM